MEICLLVDYPENLSCIAGWVFDEWGWKKLERTNYRGREVTIMYKGLGTKLETIKPSQQLRGESKLI